MSQASIPVDLFNPGQVFAALGFLEAASTVCPSTVGGFDWSDETRVQFLLNNNESINPVEAVFKFLVEADLKRIAPPGYEDPPQKKKKSKDAEDDETILGIEYSNCFPAQKPDRTALPIRLIHDGSYIDVGHWCDASSREDFKLYAGNRSAAGIAQAMLVGTAKKGGGNKKIAENLLTKGIRTLWHEDPFKLTESPFDVLTPMGGSFNVDPRGAWTALDTGYSPNDQKHAVTASPVVELLAAIGLQHARPVVNRDERITRVKYSVWEKPVPPSLARALFSGGRFGVPLRTFTFTLAASGKNKIVTFAEEEVSS